jgi:uncharacterized protein (DUF983 family)
MDFHTLKIGWQCLCPKCETSHIFKGKYSLDLKETCDKCGLDLAKNDSADGAAVLLIFLLGFSVVPLALVVDLIYPLPYIVHGIVWGILMIAITLGLIKPIKAYIIALQYKHRPNDWT